ncbi:MAG TPA: hypothetical protein VJO33_06770, partial [Gemmatimonadaceae bacterium]|nr:hypothetical protein [Gemmatimonadaceae bacterium]
RLIVLEFSWSLGPVTYHVGKAFVDHAAYLHALGVAAGTNRYPGVSDDPLQAFRDLAHDIATYCSDFVTGAAVICSAAAETAAIARAARHRRDTARYVGDDAKRSEAREAFEACHYEHVIALLESVQDPSFLDPSDHSRLAIARRRAIR